jgi:hypothetical protein
MAALLSELEVLYQALATPYGVVVECNNFNLAQQRLYKARREAGDPELARLQIRRSPYRPDAELWLVRGPAPEELL